MSRQWVCCDPGFCRFYQDVALGIVLRSLQSKIVEHLAHRKIGDGLFSVNVPNAALRGGLFGELTCRGLATGAAESFFDRQQPHLHLCLAALALLRYITSNVDSSMTRAVPVLSF